MTNANTESQRSTDTATDPQYLTRADRLIGETGHPETLDEVIETCERTYRHDLAADISHLVNELKLNQYGFTTNWLDMPNRDGEDAYALMMAFRAGMAIAGPADTPEAIAERTVPEQ